MYGYAGQMLRVNLTNKTVQTERLDEATARRCLGGRGLGAKLLFDELRPGTDPLGPDNKLLFLTGPITGTPSPMNTRYMAVGKSPLTGIYGEANSSGSFGRELKFAGYDAIIVEGKAESPVYVWVKDGQVEIRDARHLWGRMVGEVDDAVKGEVGDPKSWVAAIGPSGEKLVKFACIITDKHRAAGRTGLGAVMGSKNLKAIAARGTGAVPLADPGKTHELFREIARRTRQHSGLQDLSRYGTSGSVDALNEMGILPTRNFREGVFEGHDKITGQTMARTIMSDKVRCFGCTLTCNRMVEVPDSQYGPIQQKYGGPEYETMAAFGSLCGIDDLVAIARANQLCNMYGADTISAGVVIAWAMECYEKGILTERALDGIALRWGDAKAMIRLLEKICQREGIGNLLAEGVRKASAQVGQGSEQFAIHAKGLEIAMHEPRGKKGLAIVYATGPRGGCHTEATHDPSFEVDNLLPEIGITKAVSRFSIESKPELIKKTNDLRVLTDATGGCIILDPVVGAVDLPLLTRLLAAITGWDLTIEELMRVGERANNLARAFNVREGISRKDDVLPPRFAEPLPRGASQGYSISPEEFNQMLDEYYRQRGWTPNGIPTREKLVELGLEQVAVELGA